MNNVITSLDVKNNTDKTVDITYTANFTGTNHINYGSFTATVDEATAAFKGMTSTDMWAGFKTLILTRLKDEATSAMAGDTSD